MNTTEKEANGVPKTTGHSREMTALQKKASVKATNTCITSTKDESRRMFE